MVLHPSLTVSDTATRSKSGWIIIDSGKLKTGSTLSKSCDLNYSLCALALGLALVVTRLSLNNMFPGLPLVPNQGYYEHTYMLHTIVEIVFVKPVVVIFPMAPVIKY